MPTRFPTLSNYSKYPYILRALYTVSRTERFYYATSYLTEKCAVLTGNSAGFRTHTENGAFHSGNPTISSVYLPTPRWHHLKAHPFLAIHSADEHRMIYSFPNTTSYSTFYAFFSYFRITLWPMWLANSKRQPCFYPP